MIGWRCGVVLAALAALSSPAAVGMADPTDIVADLIHADVPLYGADWDDLWPRSFVLGDDFGCESRVPFGDWRFTPDPADPDPEPHWERFANYGAFHCAAVLRTANDRAGLDAASWRYGFFVKLGSGRRDGQLWELWAIQSGMVPGSDYVLLAREAKTSSVDQFRVLQQRCPAAWYRQGGSLDSWVTRYCAVNARTDLLALARRMLALPPRGVLSRVVPEP